MNNWFTVQEVVNICWVFCSELGSLVESVATTVTLQAVILLAITIMKYVPKSEYFSFLKAIIVSGKCAVPWPARTVPCWRKKKKITFMILGDSLLQIQLIESKHCSFTHFIFFSFKPTDKLIAVFQKRTEPLMRPLDRPAGSPVSPLCLHLGSQSMTGWLSPLALL